VFLVKDKGAPVLIPVETATQRHNGGGHK